MLATGERAKPCPCAAGTAGRRGTWRRRHLRPSAGFTDGTCNDLQAHKPRTPGRPHGRCVLQGRRSSGKPCRFTSPPLRRASGRCWPAAAARRATFTVPGWPYERCDMHQVMGIVDGRRLGARHGRVDEAAPTWAELVGPWRAALSCSSSPAWSPHEARAAYRLARALVWGGTRASTGGTAAQQGTRAGSTSRISASSADRRWPSASGLLHRPLHRHGGPQDRDAAHGPRRSLLAQARHQSRRSAR